MVRIFADIPWRLRLLTFVSAVLQALIFPNPAISWLSWIALVPLLIALMDCKRPLHGFILAFECGVIWYLFTCMWIFHVMHVYGGLSSVLSLFVLFLFAIYMGLYPAFFGWLFVRLALHEKFGISKALVVAPFIWITVELARTHVVSFPWNLLGYAQIENVGLTRLATVTGVYGVSFVIIAVNVLFAFASLKGPIRDRVFLAAMSVALVLQSLSVIHPPLAAAHQQVTLLQPNLPMNDSQWTQDEFDKNVTEFARKSSTGAQSSNEPKIILWPESPAPFYENDPKLRVPVMTLAGKQNAFVVMGVYGLESRQVPGQPYDVYNSALIIAPNGERLGRYDKIHLVPFGEYVPFKSMFFFLDSITHDVGGFSRGTERKVFKLNTAPLAAPMPDMPGMEHNAMPPTTASKQASTPKTLSIIICYEAVFPDEVRQFVNNGAQVLLNISNDGWYGPLGATRQHLNIVRMRAIENHRWLLRATNTGITATIDPYGRLISQTKIDQAAVLHSQFEYLADTTFYTHHGDLFAYLCAIITLVTMLITFIGKKKTN